MKILNFLPQDGLSISHRKENHFNYEYALIAKDKDGKLRPFLLLRGYGTPSKEYVCLWIYTNTAQASGSGSAGGYGYHKASAAAQDAFGNAGIDLSERIAGVGDSATEEAIKAFAEHIGLADYLIHKAHP